MKTLKQITTKSSTQGEKNDKARAEHDATSKMAGLMQRKLKEDTDNPYQLDEVSTKTLVNYVAAAAQDVGHRLEKAKNDDTTKPMKKILARSGKIGRAKAHIQMKANEEVEHIDEVSKELANRYMHSAIDDRSKTDAKVFSAAKKNRDDFSFKRHDSITKNMAKSDKRTTGIGRALNRLTKEEVEQVDELNKSTLASYAVKAVDSHGVRSSNYGDSIGDRKLGGAHLKYSDYHKERAARRAAGLKKAVVRLAKEEVEQIDELGHHTLVRYTAKASSDAVDHMVKAGEFKDIADRIKSRKPSAAGKNLIKRAETQQQKSQAKANKRSLGVIRATKKLKEGHVPDHSGQLNKKDSETMSKVAALMAKEKAAKKKDVKESMDDCHVCGQTPCNCTSVIEGTVQDKINKVAKIYNAHRGLADKARHYTSKDKEAEGHHMAKSSKAFKLMQKLRQGKSAAEKINPKPKAAEGPKSYGPEGNSDIRPGSNRTGD